MERVSNVLRLLGGIHMRHDNAEHTIVQQPCRLIQRTGADPQIDGMPVGSAAMQICVASCTVAAPCSISMNRKSWPPAFANSGAAMLRR